MKGKIKINRASANNTQNKTYSNINTIQDKLEEEKHLIITNNHILKKHYQNFKVSRHEIEKLKKRLKLCNSDIILNQIINQGDSIYSLVNNFYNEIVEKLDTISEQISAISNCVNFLQELNNNNYSNINNANNTVNNNVSPGTGSNKQQGFNAASNSSFNNSLNEGRPNSMKISTKHFYLEKVNKLKKLESEFSSKSKAVSLKLSQFEEDSKFLEKITKEKDLLIDALSEDQLRRIGESYSHEIQINAMKLILTSYFKTDISISATEKDIVDRFKVRILLS